VNGRGDRLQKNPKARPGSKSRQPEAKKPVVLGNGFWTGHALVSAAVSKCEDDGRLVRMFVE
jgi:hypothetical protein